MEHLTRALRRHHLARLKRQWRQRQDERLGGLPPPAQARHIGRRARTATPCSCPLCGNPRRHYGESTLQERRARQRDRSAGTGSGSDAG